MNIAVVTLFPAMLDTLRAGGVTARAAERGLFTLAAFNPRDFATDRHRTVDDRPYGGGPGMVLMFEPMYRAIRAAHAALGPGPARAVLLSPQGARLDQAAVRRLAGRERLVLVCGRYEGVDERLVEAAVDEEVSLGDFVLSGGEPAALALIDAMVRLLPEALGHGDSAAEDSFADGLLDWPHYTRPERLGAGARRESRAARAPRRQPRRHPPLAGAAGARPDLAAAPRSASSPRRRPPCAP